MQSPTPADKAVEELLSEFEVQDSRFEEVSIDRRQVNGAVKSRSANVVQTIFRKRLGNRSA